MASTIFAGNKNSQYDSDMVIKEVHDFHGQALRTLDTRSLVDKYYTHLRAEYDVNKPVIVNYYRGTQAQKTNFNGVVAGSNLDGTYFTINSAPDNQKYAVWFNLDGTSIQPVVANSKYIEVNIATGDSAEIVVFAIALVLNLYKDQFVVTRNGINVEIKNVGLGEADSSTVGTSPFTFTVTAGTQELVKNVVIAYLASDPIYEGQVLKGYYYDIYSGKFLRSATVDVENLTVNVALEALTGTDPDNVLIVGSENGERTGVKHALKIDNLNDAAVHDSRVNVAIDEVNNNLENTNNSLDLIALSLDNIESAKLNGFSLSAPDSVQLTGSLDGTVTGTKFGVVNNLRQQILATHNREQSITYSDFGTKNQRIISVDYSSDTFPGIIARKVINYVLVSGRYRRDSINWSII